MSSLSNYDVLARYAHIWNWLPDSVAVKDVCHAFQESYSALFPFAYSYMEELIRSMTGEYCKAPPEDEKERKVRRKAFECARCE